MRKTSVIPSGVTLVGDVEGDADLVVYGRIEGPIHVGGSLVIEASGVVRGHVRARAVVVRGVLKGNAFGDELVRVDEGARLVGELTAPRVQVVPGAHFRGQIHVATVGEPRLTIYDPTLHTFSGWPSPEPLGALPSSPSVPGTLAAPSVPGTLAAPVAARTPVPPARPAPLAQAPMAAPVEQAPMATPVEPPSFGDPTDTTLSEANTPELTRVLHDELAASELTRVVDDERVVDDPIVDSGHVVDALQADDLLADDSASVDVDATLSEATTYPPPPERLPLRMPRLGGRTPGTRRWT